MSFGSGAAHILALGLDARLRKFGLDGVELATGSVLGTEVLGGLAIDPVDVPSRAFGCIDRSIVLIDVASMAIVERSETIGGSTCLNGDLHVLPGAGDHERLVVAGSATGVFDLRWFKDEVFTDGFD